MDGPLARASRERVVSGIRATGRLHLGNYLGAVRAFAEFSVRPEFECYFFVADLHTLATVGDPAVLRARLPDIVLDYLAAGVDPERAALFIQSSIPETCELAWMLSSVTFVGELERVPTFRERERNRADGEPLAVGLLNYPLLMAADVLGLRAHRVPVGEDQYPHLELVRDLARRLNKRHFPDVTGGYFPEPAPASTEPVRVPGLDGSGKMGKSSGAALGLMDPPAERWRKLEAAVTDPARRTQQDAGTPERCGVYAIHELVSRQARVAEVAAGCRAAQLACAACKSALNDSMTTVLEPLQVRRRELEQRTGLVREVLHEGAKRARRIIVETRDAVYERAGIVRY